MVNGINCQNYQLLIGRKEMVVLRWAQSKTFTVILSSSFPVILSLPRPVILSSSKDDPRERLRICDSVPLRQAQSDRKSKDDTRGRLRVFDTVPLRRAQSDSRVQSDSVAQSDRKSKDDTIEGRPKVEG